MSQRLVLFLGRRSTYRVVIGWLLLSGLSAFGPVRAHGTWFHLRFVVWQLATGRHRLRQLHVFGIQSAVLCCNLLAVI
jgi:hypothetical protein